jgi:urease accessory protein
MADKAMSIDQASLIKLMTWLSPAFPVGGFGYSSGLEWAVRDGMVKNAADVATWLAGILDHGAPWSDAVLFAEAWRVHDDEEKLADLTELARALAPSAERLLETTQLGSAFSLAAMAYGRPPARQRAPYPVVVGALAGQHGIALESALTAFLHALLSSAVSAAVRLVPLGQSEGVVVLARLARAIESNASRAAKSSLDDLGTFAFMADIATMKHETLEPRLFRT